MEAVNAALLRAFRGDRGNALNELRAYRIPPLYTQTVLQCALLLNGYGEEDCR